MAIMASSPLFATLVLACLLTFAPWEASAAHAQAPHQKTAHSSAKHPSVSGSPQATDPIEQASYSAPDDFFDGANPHGPDCGDCVADVPCDYMRCYHWTAGFEATFLQPRYASNVGFTRMEADGVSFERFTDADFDYGLEFSPRAFIGLAFDDGVGFRATWWQFDHDAAALATQPPANGFGDVFTPQFGAIDISSNIPTDTLTATSALSASTIDLEFINQRHFEAWRLGLAYGLRYASTEQTYLAELRNAASNLRGRIDYQHDLEGIGPTLSLASALPVTQTIDLFATGRASLLFGEATSHLTGGEDLDLTSPFTTTKNTTHDDFLPIAELRLGLRWNGKERCGQAWHPFATVALEGQLWSGAGSATSEEGNLSFVGVTSGAGVSY